MKSPLSRNMKLIVGLAFALVIVLSANALLTNDRTYAQAGRKSSDKQKKNPNASGDPDEASATEQGRPDRQKPKVDKTVPPATMSIDTNIVNVEAVVYNKKTGGILQ